MNNRKDGISIKLNLNLLGTLFFTITILFTIIVPPSLSIFVYGIQWSTLIWLLVLGLSIISIILNIRRGKLPNIALIFIAIFPFLQPIQEGAGSKVFAVLPLFALIFLFIAWKFSDVSKTNLAICLLYMSLPLNIFAIVQIIFGNWLFMDSISLPEFRSMSYFGRPASTFGHPIAYGAFASSIIIICLTYNIKSTIRYFALSASIVGLVASGSRSSIIPLTFIICYILIRQLIKINRRTKFKKYHVMLFLASILFLAIFTVYGLSFIKIPTVDITRYQNIQESYSAIYRISQWSEAYRLITFSPTTFLWGHGPGASTELLNATRLILLDGPKTFDNTFVTLAYDYGIVGVLIIVFAITYAISAPGNVTGKLMLIFLLMNSMFFDAFLWPSFISLLIISIIFNQNCNRDNKNTSFNDRRCNAI